MQPISQFQITELASNVIQLLQENQIDYILYGSLAFTILTNNVENEVQDIDIIVRQTAFEKIASLVKKLKLNPIITPFSIHANSLEFIGKDLKPFDVSFDSFEHYFQDQLIGFTDTVSKEVNDQTFHCLSSQKMILLYKIGLEKGNPEKREEYQRKIALLEETSGSGLII